MFCDKCGRQTREGAVYCPYCGVGLPQSVSGNAANPPQPEQRRQTTAKAGGSGAKKWIIAVVAIAAVIFALAYIPGHSWTCDECGKKWLGTAYYGWDYEDTYCEDCAVDYWSPFPIENYEK